MSKYQIPFLTVCIPYVQGPAYIYELMNKDGN